MTRVYSDLANENIKVLLGTIADKSNEPTFYRETMTKIVMSLGDALLTEIDNNESSVYLACTVEDTDFLARGILDRLENRELFYIEINSREVIAHSPQRCF